MNMTNSDHIFIHIYIFNSKLETILDTQVKKLAGMQKLDKA